MQTAVALTENNLVLGRYRPLRPLGSGGGGSVWLARDEHEDRDVALKVVEREGKPGARAEREVDAATRLRHPRCLRALALARDDNHVYVAYPYVAGRTLRDALRNGAVDDWGAVEAGAQVLEALAHAHSKGVVHRDVKPANVMLEEGDEVSVRLLDFGLAQLEQADTLTAFGDVPGTLAYIAPERLAGEETTGAADVWAVGVLLWESLAGRHPFWAVSPLETARRIEQGAQPLAEVRPDLPRELTRAVDRMLSTDPRKRPQAGDALTLLRSAEEGRGERRRATTSPAVLRERAPHAALAALFAGSAAFLLPFFPTGWPFLLGALAGLTAFLSPTAGLAVALAVPVLPLGNISLGLALAYLPVALAWLIVFARDARSSLLFLSGPLLGFRAPAPARPRHRARGAWARPPGRRRRRSGAGRGRDGDRRRSAAAAHGRGRAKATSASAAPRSPASPSTLCSRCWRAGRRWWRPSSSPRWRQPRRLWLGPAVSGGSRLGERPSSPSCSLRRSPLEELPSILGGRRRRSGWRPARSRIRWFGHPDRVTSGHNGCPV